MAIPHPSRDEMTLTLEASRLSYSLMVAEKLVARPWSSVTYSKEMTTHDETTALVLRAQQGDRLGFDALARLYLKPAYALALAVLRRPAEAEDVAQDALIRALESINDCRDPDRFGGWLMRIVRNRALNRIDSLRVREARSIPHANTGETMSAKPEQIGLRDRLVDAVSKLPEARAEVALLHDLADWTHAEIAAALGISDVMSRQHLFQARRQLRELLTEDAPTGGDS